jgi:hypothetical protein
VQRKKGEKKKKTSIGIASKAPEKPKAKATGQSQDAACLLCIEESR